MRVLTIHQPYATAIIQGLKSYENRSWRPRVDGPFPLLIHASRRVLPLAEIPPELHTVLAPLLDQPLPTSAIIGSVVVTGFSAKPILPWGRGPVLWHLASPCPCDPVTMHGKMGLWSI